MKPDHNNSYIWCAAQQQHNMYNILLSHCVLFTFMWRTICKQSVYGLFISLSHKLYSKIINDGDYVLCVCLYMHINIKPWMQQPQHHRVCCCCLNDLRWEKNYDGKTWIYCEASFQSNHRCTTTYRWWIMVLSHDFDYKWVLDEKNRQHFVKIKIKRLLH